MADTRASDRSTGLDWGAAVSAGLLAGLVFVIMEMILVATAGGGSAWGPPRMMAAIVMGNEVLPGPENPPTFDFGIFIVGMIVHFVLSVVLALILAAILAGAGAGSGAAVAIGAAFGLVVYLVNFYGFTAIFPWFENARNWITIASHIVFGAVLGGSYAALARSGRRGA